MQNMNEIRQHIRAIEQTRKITNAMDLVSSSRMKRVMPHVNYNRLYFSRVQAAMEDIIASSQGFHHPYLDDRGDQSVTYIVISGDKGMAGDYNSNILNFAWEHMQGHPTRRLYTVGITATQFFSARGIEPEKQIIGASQDPSLYNARHMTQDIFRLYDAGQTDRVYVIYTAFFGTAKWYPVIHQLLPIPMAGYEQAAGSGTQMIYHPSPEEVFHLLVPQYTIGILFGALVQAYASEHCARMHAMQSATQNADEMLKKLHTQFNIARQAAITQEISEIAGAAQALRALEDAL
nr:ATP synthase F1 subunit gamma [bacterium]